MNAVKRRLIGLNLAVLMVLSASLPAAAATQSGTNQAAVPLYVSPATYEAAVLPGVFSTRAGESFFISVGNIGFSSASDASGDGWYYRAANRCLELTNYQGGAIRSNGNLTVYTKGTVSITGASKAYAESGITVSGSLTLFATGSLTVTGGNGTAQAGNAIVVSETIRLYAGDGTATLFGGSALSSRVSGGCALRGKQVYLSGGQVNAVGGSGYDSPGGYAIYSDTVRVEANGSYQGGTGSVDAAGICFFSTCHFGVVNAEVTGGGTSAYPVCTGTPPGDVYLNPHTTIDSSANKYVIRVRSYKLLLHGSGGVNPEGNSTTTLQHHSPTCFDLQEYIFRRDGYVQMGWTESSQSGAWIALNAVYPTDTDLYAYWVRADAGDILLNGLGGTFSDSSHWQKYSGAPVTLPNALSGASVPAWGSEANPAGGKQNLLSGIWYAANDIVQPDPDSATVLYARTAQETYTIYHPTQGSVTAGGTILLQEVTSTGSDLVMYTPDASALFAPSGYKFSGWSDREGGDVIYAPGALITHSGRETVHLYAVWESTSVQYVPEPGVTVLYAPGSDRVQVVLSDAWCADNAVEQGLLALYEQTDVGNRMMRCAMEQRQAGQDLVLEISFADTPSPYFSVFSLTGDFTPAAACISFDLSVFS